MMSTGKLTGRIRNAGAGRRSGQLLPEVCGGCGAYVRDAHTTPKAQVQCRAEALRVSIELETPSAKGDPIGELVAPDGRCFEDGGLHALTFTDWRDALNQIRTAVLVDCPSDCDCQV